MLSIEIPGFGTVQVSHLVSDFTGTLSVDGLLLPGVKELLADVSRVLKVHVLTADTFQRASFALKDVECSLTVLSGNDIDRKKERFVQDLDPEQVIAIGNGANDRLMLKAARIGIAVIEGEGCAVGALVNADIAARNICDALELLLNPKRCLATLRR
jgi:P-type E1-E2 ATPase